jgi:hypothetical protein
MFVATCFIGKSIVIVFSVGPMRMSMSSFARGSLIMFFFVGFVRDAFSAYSFESWRARI